jgi:hypothetical protein
LADINAVTQLALYKDTLRTCLENNTREGTGDINVLWADIKEAHTNTTVDMVIDAGLIELVIDLCAQVRSLIISQ